MNSEFPMTFVETDVKQGKAKTKQSSSSPRAKAFSHSSNDRKATVKAARKKVIPISDVSLVNLSRARSVASIAPSLRPQNSALYPMSEFDDSGHAGKSQTYQRSPMRFLLRLSLVAALGGLWIAIGLGELHSDSQSVTSTREYLISKIPSLAGVLNADAKVSSGQTSGVQEVSESMQILSDAEMTQIPSGAEIVKADTSSGLQNSELSAMLDLFLEQGRQMQKVESHLMGMVKNNASREEYSRFLLELKKRHELALELIERQK